MQSSTKPAVSLPFFLLQRYQPALKGSQKLTCVLQRQTDSAPREVLSFQFKKQGREFLRAREKGGILWVLFLFSSLSHRQYCDSSGGGDGSGNGQAPNGGTVLFEQRKSEHRNVQQSSVPFFPTLSSCPLALDTETVTGSMWQSEETKSQACWLVG